MLGRMILVFASFTIPCFATDPGPTGAELIQRAAVTMRASVSAGRPELVTSSDLRQIKACFEPMHAALSKERLRPHVARELRHHLSDQSIVWWATHFGSILESHRNEFNSSSQTLLENINQVLALARAECGPEF